MNLSLKYRGQGPIDIDSAVKFPHLHLLSLGTRNFLTFIFFTPAEQCPAWALHASRTRPFHGPYASIGDSAKPAAKNLLVDGFLAIWANVGPIRAHVAPYVWVPSSSQWDLC